VRDQHSTFNENKGLKGQHKERLSAQETNLHIDGWKDFQELSTTSDKESQFTNVMLTHNFE
jgi:hypothetical protein